MQKWLIRGGISAFVVSCFVSAGACGGDDNGTGSGNDSGIGSDGSQSDVVSTNDSGSDSGKPPGPATLTILQDGSPFAGGKVVFYDETGAPQPVITTGADGKATMVVKEGWSATGSVVSAGGSPTQTTLLSFVGIEPGDDLVMQTFVSAAAAAVINVDQPTGAVSGTISAVHYSVGCGYNSYSPGGPGTASFSAACSHALTDGGSTFSLLVTALDASQNTIAYAQMTDVPFTGSGQHVTGLTWSAATNLSITLTGSPATAPFTYGAQSTFVGGGLDFGNSNAYIVSDGGLPSLSLGTPVGSFANQASFAFAMQYGSVLGGFNYVAHKTLANDGANYPVDFGTMAPSLTAGTLVSDDGGGVSASITPSASVSGYDGTLLSIYFYEQIGDSGTYDTALWNIVAPAGTTVLPPKLTSDLAAFVPSNSTMYLNSFQIQKATTFGSYAAFRKGYARYPQFRADDTEPFVLEETGIAVPH